MLAPSSVDKGDVEKAADTPESEKNKKTKNRLYVVPGQYSNDQFAARAATSLGFGYALINVGLVFG